MKILFLFSKYPESPHDSNLHRDLPDVFCWNGHEVYVATIRERRVQKKSELSYENDRYVLRVRTGNVFNGASRFEKAFSLLFFQRNLQRQILKNWGDVKFDLIVGSTPWTASDKLIKKLKIYYQCPAFLILWDIFPQNAKDLGIIKNKMIFSFFEKRSMASVSTFDFVGCMSSGNQDYIVKNYKNIDASKLLVFPLWSNAAVSEGLNNLSRYDLGYDAEDFIVVFGGNMGKPQNLENIAYLAQNVKAKETIKFLFVGSGSELGTLKRLVDRLHLKNVQFLEHVDRHTYEKILQVCDIGLVSLSPKFTVPNFPSKTVDYAKHGLPILASLDKAAMLDYGNFIERIAKIGLCSDAGNVDLLSQNLLALHNDHHLRGTLADNCNVAVKKYFDINNNYRIIMSCVS